MQVRMKLDTCGVKLKLNHWNQFSQEERQQLAMMPCEDKATAAIYREFLQELVTQHQGSPAKTLPIDPMPPWQDETVIPDSVINQAENFGCSLTIAQWKHLQPIQRFALIKLSRPGHENRNFEPALRELGLRPQ